MQGRLANPPNGFTFGAMRVAYYALGGLMSRGYVALTKSTAEEATRWPRKDNFNHGLERPDGDCRSGSAS